MSCAYQFLSNRLHALAGYYSPPSTYDAMDFYLPKFSVTVLRVVRIKDRLWELWSPNSKVHAYYPGIRNDTLKLGIELPTSLRRSDGHLGRFDYTVSPQHFDFLRPWLGFIRKWNNDSRPENARFLETWTPSYSSNSGHFRSSFVRAMESRIRKLLKSSREYARIAESHPDLWQNRPQHFSAESMPALETEMRLDNAVDLLASVQRDTKELSAWNRMADTILRDIDSNLEGIPPADDSLIGVWLNGCDEVNGLWLLRHRVPCYIVHEGDSDADWQRSGCSTFQSITMIAGTGLAQLEPEIRRYERRLLADGQILGQLDQDMGLGSYSNIKASSLASRIMATPRGQGLVDGRYEDLRSRGLTVDSSPRVMYTEIDGKMIPPEVVTAKAKGSWSHWMQDTLEDGTDCMRRRSSHFQRPRDQHLSYDRHLKRMLYTDEPPSIPRHYDADVNVFGIPAPDLPYIEMQNERNVVNHSPSLWCYLTTAPARSDDRRLYHPTPLSNPPPTAVHDSDDEISLGEDDEDEVAWRATYLPSATSVTAEIQDEPMNTTPDSPASNEDNLNALSSASQVISGEFEYRESLRGRREVIRSPFNNYRRSSRSRSPSHRANSFFPSRPSLLDRMGPLSNNVREVGESPPSYALAMSNRVPERTLELFPTPTQAPVATLHEICQGSQTKFLLLWNIPVVYSWDNILSWILGVLRLSYGSQLLKVHRSNEGGHQVFWLAFASERHAVTFRGVVAERWTQNGHLVKCDFVTRDEYNSIGGRCVDRWVKGKGFIGDFNPASTFPNDIRSRLSHPRLASRLGVKPNNAHVPTKRGKRRPAAGSNVQSPDGGAL